MYRSWQTFEAEPTLITVRNISLSPPMASMSRFLILGGDRVSSAYNPVGGVAFARLTPQGDILPLGVWRHPTVSQLDYGDVQVFANHAYVTGESPGYGLVIFDLTQLRGRTPCPSPEDCADTGLNQSFLVSPWSRRI